MSRVNDILTQRYKALVAETSGTAEVSARDRAMLAELEMRMNRPEEAVALPCLTAALRYASIGWPVFPLIPQSRALRMPKPYPAVKRPMTEHGFHDATTDVAVIHRWWTDSPDSGIGLATGHLFDVIDIDPLSGGLESWDEIKTSMPVEVCGEVLSARAGTHLYIKPTGMTSKAGLRKGIDYRGTGGYIVAPPTHFRHPSQRWSWIVPPSAHIRKAPCDE